MGFIKINTDEQYGITYNGTDYEIKCTGSEWTEIQNMLKNEKDLEDKSMISILKNYVKQIIPDLDVENINVFHIITITGGIKDAIAEKIKKELSPVK